MEEVKGYDISEQLDHIAYMFNVRTKGKKYENFIVNAIYTKVGNPDLMPVTQQYVRNPNDSRKCYLLDLYFPQINFGVEIDEGQHMSEEHQASDKERAEAESAKSVLKEMDTYFYDGALDLIKLYISNGVFVFFDFSVPVYIIVNGLILLTFFLIYNSIYSTKM